MKAVAHPTSGRAAIGAVIVVESRAESSDSTRHHQLQLFSSREATAHFGLGSAQEVERILVRWPDGSSETFGPFTAKNCSRGTGGGRQPMSRIRPWYTAFLLVVSLFLSACGHE